MGATPRRARRCWPAIRIWPSAFPASGTWRGSRRRRACWPARPRPACRSWCSAITATSPGPSPPPAPTCRTSSWRRQPARTSTRHRTAHAIHRARGADQGPRPAPDEVLTVRETRHGPVISDLTSQDGPITRRADGQSGAGQHRRRRPARAQPRADDVEEAGKAAADDHLAGAEPAGRRPRQIALYVTGRVPVRRAGDGAAPVPGDGSHDWTGWASGEQLPHHVTPQSGRLVNANERIAPPDFPGVPWPRLVRRLARHTHPRACSSRSDKLTAADFARMQIDVHSAFARADAARALLRAAHR